VVTVKNNIWGVMLCGSSKNQRFGGIRHLANALPSLPILITLMMVEIHSSKTLVLTRATQCHIPEGGIFLNNG
jgi:hypothetical protein